MSTVLVLANSAKTGGRCVAGVDLESNTWVRPVTAAGSGSLSAVQTRASWAEGLREVAPLHVVRMELGSPRPTPYHPEDVLRGRDTWAGVDGRRVASVVEEFDGFIVPGPELLGSRGDRLSLAQIAALGAAHQSLALVRPGEVSFHQTTSMRGNPQIRASFWLMDAHYNLSVTDLTLAPNHLPATGDYLLTISLGVPFRPTGEVEDFCFKIVAGVMPIQ